MSRNGEKILSGATTAFIDSTNKSSAAYKPDFISNDHTKGVKVLTSIEEELKRCDSFTFSVAFITLGGIEPLLLTFKELEERGVPGKVLTITCSQTLKLSISLRSLRISSYVCIMRMQCYQEYTMENI